MAPYAVDIYSKKAAKPEFSRLAPVRAVRAHPDTLQPQPTNGGVYQRIIMCMGVRVHGRRATHTAVSHTKRRATAMHAYLPHWSTTLALSVPFKEPIYVGLALSLAPLHRT